MNVLWHLAEVCSADKDVGGSAAAAAAAAASEGSGSSPPDAPPSAFVARNSDEWRILRDALSWAWSRFATGQYVPEGQAMLWEHLPTVADCAYAVQHDLDGVPVVLLLTRDHLAEECAYLVNNAADAIRLPVRASSRFFDGSVFLGTLQMKQHGTRQFVLYLYDVVALCGERFVQSATTARGGVGGAAMTVTRPVLLAPCSFDDRYALLVASIRDSTIVNASTIIVEDDEEEGEEEEGGGTTTALSSPKQRRRPVLTAATPHLTLRVQPWWKASRLPDAMLAASAALRRDAHALRGLRFVPRAMPLRARGNQNSCLIWKPVQTLRVALAVRWPRSVRAAQAQGADLDGGQVYTIPHGPNGKRTGPRSAVCVRAYVFDGEARHDCVDTGVHFMGTPLKAVVLASSTWHTLLHTLIQAVPHGSRKDGGIALRVSMPPPWARHSDAKHQLTHDLKWHELDDSWYGAPSVIVDCAVGLCMRTPGHTTTQLPDGRRIRYDALTLRVLRVAEGETAPDTWSTLMRVLVATQDGISLPALWDNIATAAGIARDEETTTTTALQWPRPLDACEEEERTAAAAKKRKNKAATKKRTSTAKKSAVSEA